MAEPQMKSDREQGPSFLGRMRGSRTAPQVYNFERIKPPPVLHREPAAGGPDKSAQPRVASGLWTALGLAFVLFASVQVWIKAQDRRWTDMLRSAAGAPARAGAREAASGVPRFPAAGPETPVRGPDLRLRWEAPAGAATYRIKISTGSGLLVYEQDGLDENLWMPPFNLLPALEPGEYSWEVQACDASGEVIGRGVPPSPVTIVE